jgi:hypothetical protein
MLSVTQLAARALRKGARIIDPPLETQYIQDEYLLWLSYANPGMLEKGNQFLIDYAIQHLPSNAPMLEIGSFCGLSTNVITHLKRVRGARNPLFTSDKWQFENVNDRPALPNSPVSFSDYGTFVKESFIRNIKLFSPDDLPIAMEMFSDEFFEAWANNRTGNDVLGRRVTLGGPLSFCYVDGNHTYECAKRDFHNCDRFLEKGGFILFDDSTLKEFGVHKLMPEIINGGGYRLVAVNPYHLFQKISSAI